MEVLGISRSDVPQAEKLIYRILNDDTKSPEDVMRDEDIPNYNWLERRDVTENLGIRRPGWADEELHPGLAETNGVAPQEDEAVPELSMSSAAPVFANIYQEVAATEQYRFALQRIVRQVRGPWSFAGMRSAIDENHTGESGSTLDTQIHGGSWVTDNKAWIGAAGELYVSLI